jgi:hypothetical protein
VVDLHQAGLQQVAHRRWKFAAGMHFTVGQHSYKVKGRPTAVPGAAAKERIAVYGEDNIDQVVFQTQARHFLRRPHIFRKKGLKISFGGHPQVGPLAHGGKTVEQVQAPLQRTINAAPCFLNPLFLLDKAVIGPDKPGNRYDSYK